MIEPASAPRGPQYLRAAMPIGALAAALLLTPVFGGDAALAANTKLACAPTKSKAAFSDSYRNTTSVTFVPLAETGGNFVQKGSKPGCVMVRFDGYVATSAANTVFVISATIDGETIFPAELQLTAGPFFEPRAWTYLIPNVAPGKHRIRFQFRSNNGNTVTIERSSTVIQYKG